MSLRTRLRTPSFSLLVRLTYTAFYRPQYLFSWSTISAKDFLTYSGTTSLSSRSSLSLSLPITYEALSLSQAFYSSQRASTILIGIDFGLSTFIDAPLPSLSRVAMSLSELSGSLRVVYSLASFGLIDVSLGALDFLRSTIYRSFYILQQTCLDLSSQYQYRTSQNISISYCRRIVISVSISSIRCRTGNRPIKVRTLRNFCSLLLSILPALLSQSVPPTTSARIIQTSALYV